MDWKEFFKLKWYKILIALFMFIILFGLTNFIDSCVGGKICPSGTVNYHPPFGCSYYPDCITESKATFLNIIHRGPIYLFELAITYFMSCLFFIRSALKKKVSSGGEPPAP
ncbi:MAG TPA: hypothetical protein VJC00_04645 [Candidatus Nanoarchaeia archaeon]|nr:hypothetical protein [Candidatus Nanoarchaeia archaeon]